MGNIDIKQLLDGFFDLFHEGIIELQYLPRIFKDEMIMLLEEAGLLELCVIGPELVLGDQSAIQKQFNGIVQGSPADPVFTVLHPDVQGFDIKVAFGRINLLQDGEPFRCFPVRVTFQVFGKYLPDIFESFFMCFFDHKQKFGIKI
jgi:hypothetical protein